MTHFRALYGYDPSQPTFDLIAQSKIKATDVVLRERKLMIRVLQDNLEIAQARMKVCANGKRKDHNFEIGDWVFIKL